MEAPECSPAHIQCPADTNLITNHNERPPIDSDDSLKDPDYSDREESDSSGNSEKEKESIKNGRKRSRDPKGWKTMGNQKEKVTSGKKTSIYKENYP